MQIVIIALLIVIIIFLFVINEKLPSRNYVEEAVRRDEQLKKERK